MAPSFTIRDVSKQAEQAFFVLNIIYHHHEERGGEGIYQDCTPSLALFSSQSLTSVSSKPASASTSKNFIPNFFSNKGATVSASENETLSFNFPPTQTTPHHASVSTVILYFLFWRQTSHFFGTKSASGSNSLLRCLGAPPAPPSATPTGGASPGAIAEAKSASSTFGPDVNKSTAPSRLPASSSTPASAAPKFKFHIPGLRSSSPLGGGDSSTAPKKGFGGFGTSIGSLRDYNTSFFPKHWYKIGFWIWIYK